MSTIDNAGNIHKGPGVPGGGQFAGRQNTAPSRSLTSIDSTVAQLEQAYFELWTDTDAGEKVRAVGEMPFNQTELATVTTDPTVLACLAGNTIADIGRHVARNPHTTAPTLHYIATDISRARAYEDRAIALHHPNTDIATLRTVWDGIDGDDSAQHLRHELAYNPNTPGDILATLMREHQVDAGRHPNLPDDVLAEAVTDPELASVVIRNPKLTDAQLRQAIAVTSVHDYDDDDSFWPAVVAAGAAGHPNASPETVEKLTKHPDAHVRKTATARQIGDRMRRNRARAEQEMRDAGGSEADIQAAGDTAAMIALDGREWGEG